MAKPKRSLLQRLRFKYKIFILNENTLEETFHIRLSADGISVRGFLHAYLFCDYIGHHFAHSIKTLLARLCRHLCPFRDDNGESAHRLSVASDGFAE